MNMQRARTPCGFATARVSDEGTRKTVSLGHSMPHT
jgi:hypothetical protein